MLRLVQIARCGFASGLIALGVIGLVSRNVNLVWGPVPHWIPRSAVLAVILALIPLASGIAILFRRTAAAASLAVFAYVLLWWVLVKVPPVLEAPLTELTWLDCGMYGMLLSGAWTLYADLDGRSSLGGERGTRAARLLFGLGLIPTGLSHFVYLKFTVPLIPSYFPVPVAWAYFTGACHLAAGLGVLFGVLPGLAARLESAMLAIFTLLVWVPRVVARPAAGGNWTELWISWALTAAAAVVAARVTPRTRQSA